MAESTSTLVLKNLVNGNWVEGANGVLESVNPANRTDVVARVPAMSATDAVAAIDAASTALPEWRATPSIERGKLLFRAADLIRSRGEELRDLIVREMGKTLGEARIEVERSAEMLEFYAGTGRLSYGNLIPDRRPGVSAQTRREPIGVVLAITPWNDPIMIPCRKMGPALISGNTVVLKPSPDTPATSLVLAEIFAKAGFPAGVVNTVTGKIEEVGDAIVRDPRIAGITFTGSTGTGKYLRGALAGGTARLQTEMGGKNTAVLMADANVDEALAALLPSIFGQTGQRCTAVSRLLVHSSLLEEVTGKLIAMAESVIVGAGSVASTTMGPAVNERQLTRVLEMVGGAADEGATIAYGGHRAETDQLALGCFVEPTVFTGVTPQMGIWRNEVFGPVVAVASFDELDDAISLVNDTAYGLAAGIFTNDLAASQAFTDRVDAGQVVVNLPPSGWDVHQPFGGFKDSGSAFKEHGLEGLAFYTRIKTVAQKPPTV